MTNNVILTMTGIHKHFLGVHALNNVNFTLKAGEVHALMGENGAGKSTLIKVLTGVYQFDQGTIEYDNKQIKLNSPLHAQKIGINTVYQEVNLCPNLSVSENIFIGREIKKWSPFGKIIDWNTMNIKSRELLEKLNLNIDVTKILSSYSVAIQQMVAIARSLLKSSKILILDEPTSSLDETEVKQLFQVIQKLKQNGLAIIFVTHFLDQVYKISDRITILRNGELVGSYQTNTLPRIQLVAQMIGKELTEFNDIPVDHTCVTDDNHKKIKLKASKIKRADFADSFNLKVHEKEVLGLAGLLGSGRSEVVRSLFGIDKNQSGTIEVNNKRINFDSPKNAVAAGMAFCPENRKDAGIFPELTVRENIILALQGKRGVFKFLNKRKQEKIALDYIKKLNIVTPSLDQKVKNLSGGNQQKVILARWLATHPEILILDEPTRGIDVGAKAEILKFILSLCNSGMGIIFISSEIDEVIHCSNRIMVLRDREVIKELCNEEINENTIMHTIARGRQA